MSAPANVPVVSVAEVQAFLRIETGEEEALIAGFIRAATALCESFINQAIMARSFSVDVPASTQWERLPVTPVRVIDSVQAVDQTGTAVSLAVTSYATDIDSSGDGWVRATSPASMARVRVAGEAGIADDPNGVPEPIRQGVIRLVSHLFSVRDGPDGELPAAVTALWRPFRRLRLGR